MLVLKLKQGHPKAAMFKPWPEEIPEAYHLRKFWMFYLQSMASEENHSKINKDRVCSVQKMIGSQAFTYSRHWHKIDTVTPSDLERFSFFTAESFVNTTELCLQIHFLKAVVLVCFHVEKNHRIYNMGPYQLRVELQPYKWPYKWVTGVITLLIGDISPFITGRGPLCLCFDVPSSELSYFISSYRYSLLALTFSSQNTFQVCHVSIENMYISETQCKGVEAIFQNVDGMYI